MNMDRENNSLKFDLKVMLENIFALSVASNVMVHADIDVIFNRDRIRYLKAYKECELYKSCLTCSSMPERALYAEKVIGIVEVCVTENDYTVMFELYKKAFRAIYTNLRYLKRVNVFTDVLPYVEKTFKGTEGCLATIYMYMCLEQLETSDNFFSFVTELIRQTIYLEYYNKTNFSKQTIATRMFEIQELKNYFGVGKRSSYKAEDFLTQILDKDFERYNKSMMLMPEKQIKEGYEVEKVGVVGRYVGALEGLCKNLQFNTADAFATVEFTKHDINCIFMNYLYGKQFNNLSENDRNLFVIVTTYMYVLNKLYSDLKDKYLTTLNDTDIIKLDELQKQCQAEQAKAKEALESVVVKEKSHKAREEELLQKIALLEKENKRLSDELESQKCLKEEVVKLRNVVFQSQETESEVILSDTQKVDVEFLNNKKTVIVGGQPSWIQDMKKVLPKAIFSGTDARNSNFDYIHADSKVFISTQTSHSAYYKVKVAVERVGANYYYINTTANIELTKREMLEQL